MIIFFSDTVGIAVSSAVSAVSAAVAALSIILFVPLCYKYWKLVSNLWQRDSDLNLTIV